MRFVVEHLIRISPDHKPVTIHAPREARVSAGRIRRDVLRILKGHTLCSMATVTPTGRAHINTAYFSYAPGVELYFLSDPDSTHCRNLAANPSMAMAIFNSSQTWGRPDRGMWLFGVCRAVRGGQAAKAERWYRWRFRAYGQWRGELCNAGPFRYRFYRFIPRQVKILNEREFGAGVFVVAEIRRSARGR